MANLRVTFFNFTKSFFPIFSIWSCWILGCRPRRYGGITVFFVINNIIQGYVTGPRGKNQEIGNIQSAVNIQFTNILSLWHIITQPCTKLVMQKKRKQGYEPLWREIQEVASQPDGWSPVQQQVSRSSGRCLLYRQSFRQHPFGTALNSFKSAQFVHGLVVTSPLVGWNNYALRGLASMRSPSVSVKSFHGHYWTNLLF